MQLGINVWTYALMPRGINVHTYSVYVHVWSITPYVWTLMHKPCITTNA
jgi:hypothetical protein